MSQLHVGEIIGGAIDNLIGALLRKEVTKNIPDIGFGDFIIIRTADFEIIGIISYLKFETYGQVQPIGLPPSERRAILPDLEDIVNANTRKVVAIPVLGYIQDKNVYHEIPPQLPNIHDPIIPSNDKTTKKFHMTSDKLDLSYLSRIWQQEIKYPAALLGRLYQNLKKTIPISPSIFIDWLQGSYEEAIGDTLPARYAATLQRYLQE